MIISINVEKASDKIQHYFKIKIVNKPGIEGKYFNIIKIIYEKPIANILMVKKLNAFPSFKINKVLDILARGIRQEKFLMASKSEKNK